MSVYIDTLTTICSGENWLRVQTERMKASTWFDKVVVLVRIGQIRYLTLLFVSN